MVAFIDILKMFALGKDYTLQRSWSLISWNTKIDISNFLYLMWISFLAFKNIFIIDTQAKYTHFKVLLRNKWNRIILHHTSFKLGEI